MNTSSPSVNTTTNPQIIRINYPRPLIDRKPDDEPMALGTSRIVISSGQSAASSVASATVPQIISILNPTITNVITTGAAAEANAKKCTFHRQCLHIQSPPQQQQPMAGQQQPQTVIQHHQIQLPLQTPPQLLHHQQMQQQIRINNSTQSNPATVAANRASTQANRDAISTNISPQLNAALLQDRYLLLDLVDGSSFYKCIDIQTQKMLVCKVSLGWLHIFLLRQLGSVVFKARLWDGLGASANRPSNSCRRFDNQNKHQGLVIHSRFSFSRALREWINICLECATEKGT